MTDAKSLAAAAEIKAAVNELADGACYPDLISAIDQLATESADARDGWISVDDHLPELVDDEDVEVFTWDGKTVEEDIYGPEFEQPAGPIVGGWVRAGEGFGDIHRMVTHWMPRRLPAPPLQASAARGEDDHG